MMRTRLVMLVIAGLLATATGLGSAPDTDALLFITSKNNATPLTLTEVRSLYLGRTTRWKNGHRVALLVRPASTPAGRTFLQRTVRMSEIDFSQHWLGVVFRGEAPAPPRVIEHDVVRTVANNAEAIAYVMRSELSPEDATLVHVAAADELRAR